MSLLLGMTRKTMGQRYEFHIRLNRRIIGSELIKSICACIEDARRKPPRNAKFTAMAPTPPAPKGIEGTGIEQVLDGSHDEPDLYRLVIRPKDTYYFDITQMYNYIMVIGGVWTEPTSRIPPIMDDLVNVLRKKLPVS